MGWKEGQIQNHRQKQGVQESCNTQGGVRKPPSPREKSEHFPCCSAGEELGGQWDQRCLIWHWEGYCPIPSVPHKTRHWHSGYCRKRPHCQLQCMFLFFPFCISTGASFLSQDKTSPQVPTGLYSFHLSTHQPVYLPTMYSLINHPSIYRLTHHPSTNYISVDKSLDLYIHSPLTYLQTQLPIHPLSIIYLSIYAFIHHLSIHSHSHKSH